MTQHFWLRYLWSFLPPSWRQGRVYRETMAMLEQHQNWSKDRLDSFQINATSRILEHAYQTTSGYRRRFDEWGVKPSDFKTPEDIRKFPTIAKEDLRDGLEEFSSDAVAKSRRVYVTTGGSTGIPFGLYWVKGYNIPKERAFIDAQRKRIGFNPGDKVAVFRGGFVGTAEKNGLWRYDPAHNELHFSSYHLKEPFLEMFLEQLTKFAPDFLYGYPSAFVLLAGYVKEKGGWPGKPLKGVMAGSENIYPGQRELIQNVFGCRAFTWYGHSEAAVLATECEHSSDYHVIAEYGLAEVLDREGRPVTQEGEAGEIVGTGFYGWATPFIRYKTRDLAVLGPGRCERCNRNYPLWRRVQGRLQEFIVTGSGRPISMVAINMHTPVFDNVRQFQFYQEKPGEVVLRLVKKPAYGPQDDANILRGIGEKLGPDTKLVLAAVDAVESAPSGKNRFLIQKLSLDRYLGDQQSFKELLADQIEPPSGSNQK